MSAKDDLAFVEFHREEACTNGMSSCSYSAFVRLLALAERGARFTPEHEARIAELEAQVKQMCDFATFGGWAFEEYWSDGEPGDIDAGDAQEKAIECGLLGRTSEVDPNATHAEGCDYSPVASASECCCFIPTRRPLIGCAK